MNARICLFVALVAAVYGATLDPSSVSVLNKARSNVYPPAKNMPVLQWDTTLASRASSWTSYCKFGANSANVGRRTETIVNSGNNAQGKANAWTFQQAVDTWFAEQGNLHYDTDNLNLRVKNFTALSWENSTTVGCGYTDCSRYGLGLYFQCLYYPRGNYAGILPYRSSCAYNPKFNCAAAGCGVHFDGCNNVDCGSCPPPPPTDPPTQAPTAAPTAAPTTAPTTAPTKAPTAAPTTAPTKAPTSAPTAAPTSAPVPSTSNAGLADPNAGTVSGTQATCIKFLGCWNDDPTGTQSVMTGSVWQSKSMTLEQCVTYCKDRNWYYAGLQNSTTCRCDRSYQGMGQTSTDQCSTRCAGNGNQKCGGVKPILVYDIQSCTAEAQCAVLGCYSKYSWSTGWSTPTHKACVSYCSSKGYSYGGFSGTQWCYCANTLTTTSKVDDSLCNTPCTDGDGMCGGSGYYTVMQATQCSPGGGVSYAPVKNSFDWRDRGNYITAVKDQGSCGSCWAHAGIASLESAWAIAGHGLSTFSIQQIMDCTAQACDGGWMTTVYNWATTNKGVALSQNYPYLKAKGTCNADYTGGSLSMKNPNVENLCNSKNTQQVNHDNLIAALQKGPVAVAVLMDDSKVHFSNGIYQDNWQPADGTNHAVLLVGYGTDVDTGLDYWLLRNSWGTGWGDGGYFRLARNQPGYGTMGVLSGCTRPLVN